MADNSPGKVQALRAIFSEKNNPVMGLMPPGGAKCLSRPWSSVDSKSQESAALKEKKFHELRPENKVLPVSEKSLLNGGDGQAKPSVSKPVIGPKPTHLLPKLKSQLSEPGGNSNGSAPWKASVGETISSFMFANNKENVSLPPPLPPVPKPRISQLQSHSSDSHNVISLDNYVCKVRRKEIPAKEKLGPAPLKPTRPDHLHLPLSRSSSSSFAFQKPPYPCPPRPVTSPPLPPISAPVIQPVSTSLWDEFEELYEDTLLGRNERPVSLIPEYTEEEEQAELYNDAAEESEENSNLSDSSLRYKKPPPPIPTEYLQPNVDSGSNEELYQDADGVMQEEFYEVMPSDEIPEDSGFPLYTNNKREIEKLRKEEEKRIRREQKEKEKREKELEKLRKKFGLTGEEIPIDSGLVKWDSKGGKGGDLPVKKGETVLILRMEGNPSGRWLVKNEKGKIGYVELTNIEVDPLSVKSVMSIRRLSVISAGEELYCEAKSEEEAIYEVTY